MIPQHSEEVLKAIHEPIPKETYKVRNFDYNGFYGRTLQGMASYEAKFSRWTNDPGIGVFECSDGKERLIPTFALIGNTSELPEQDMSNKVMFGTPSHS